jgi:hypothetical protein
MDSLCNARKKDKGYHIRNFDETARRLAKAGASIDGVDTGSWIARAVKEKFERDIARKEVSQ